MDEGGAEGEAQVVPEGQMDVYAAAEAGEEEPLVHRVVEADMEERQLEGHARRRRDGEEHRRMAAAFPGDILRARAATSLYPCPSPGDSA